MKIFNRLSVFFLMALMTLNVSMASKTVFISLDGMALFSDPAHSQDVNLLNALGNTFEAKHHWQASGSLMLGIGMRSYKGDTFDVNTSLRFLPKVTTISQGDVLQLYSPRFRNLAYNYDITSNLLLVDNIVTWTAHRLQPGFIVGIGRASNTTSNYNEVPLTSHAAPSLDNFSKNKEAQLAYEAGAVLDYSFSNVILECAYRYLDAGRGRLGLSPLQNTRDQLSTGPLHYHAISIGIRLHHAF
jgi:opacity protein-like surface antigen